MALLRGRTISLTALQIIIKIVKLRASFWEEMQHAIRIGCSQAGDAVSAEREIVIYCRHDTRIDRWICWWCHGSYWWSPNDTAHTLCLMLARFLSSFRCNRKCGSLHITGLKFNSLKAGKHAAWRILWECVEFVDCSFIGFLMRSAGRFDHLEILDGSPTESFRVQILFAYWMIPQGD